MPLLMNDPNLEKFREELKASRSELIEILLGFISDKFGAEITQDAWDEFFGWKNHSGFDPENPVLQLFMPWLFYDWIIDNGLYPNAPEESTLAQALLDSKDAQLTDLQREYAQLCVQTGMSFFEVLEVKRGLGFKLHDLLTDETIEVYERAGSVHINQGFIIFGKVVTIRDFPAFESMAPIAIPPSVKPDLIELRDDIENQSGDVTAAVLRDWDGEIVAFYQSIYSALYPTEGEETAEEAEETLGAIQAIVKAHWEKWLETGTPALDGLSPLEAVESASGREQVRELISRLEVEAEDGLHPGTEPELFAELRQRLGLTKDLAH
jgi:hypothetical protein